MKKLLKTLLTILISLAPLSALSAYDWSAHNINVTSSSPQGSKTEVFLQSSKGQFSVVYQAEDSARFERIAKLQNQLFSLNYLKVSTIRFNLTPEGSIEVLMTPSSFTYQQTNFLDYIPGKILFVYEGSLEYNFRIAIDKIFIRIKGYFTEEVLLCKQIASAIQDPKAYIKKRDPEYMLSKLDKMQATLEKLKLNEHRTRTAVIALFNDGVFSGPTPIDSAVLEKVLEVKNQNPAFTAEQTAQKLNESGVDISSGDVEIIFKVYYNEFD